ncbi:hypothetical protein LR48_Vigan02g158500 [Vigna angularis]|uniref:Uncharacterized protein n=1 Tax=Phaseolus angularis TaxID=3914 RepID=A0A0L9TY10_PHAAN|nr:hypothetical protein LR48_Vigan02g158500 [Vigna angularis]
MCSGISGRTGPRPALRFGEKVLVSQLRKEERSGISMFVRQEHRDGGGSEGGRREKQPATEVSLLN